MIWEHFVGSIKSIDQHGWLLIFMLTFMVVLVWRAHCGPSGFNVEHLIADPATGKVVLEKFAMLLALMISTWGFVVLVRNDKLTEWYFIGYMAAWAATRGITSWIASKNKEHSYGDEQRTESRDRSRAADARARFADYAGRSRFGPDRGPEDFRS